MRGQGGPEGQMRFARSTIFTLAVWDAMPAISALRRAKSSSDDVESLGCAPTGTKGACDNMTTVAPVAVNSFKRSLIRCVNTEYHCRRALLQDFPVCTLPDDQALPAPTNFPRERHSASLTGGLV